MLYATLYSAWDPVAGLLWTGVTAVPMLIGANYVQSEVLHLVIMSPSVSARPTQQATTGFATPLFSVSGCNQIITAVT